MTDENNQSCNRRRINVGNRNLPEIAEEAWNALESENNPERYFRLEAGLVRVYPVKEKGIVVEILNSARLSYELARAADWYKIDKMGVERDAIPPAFVIKDMLSNPDPPLPHLSGILEAPAFFPDGKLHLHSGYSRSTKCYLNIDDTLKIPNVPEKPTYEDIIHAKELIEDLIGDFPFISDAEKAHAISLMLLPFVRNLIDGPTPLYLIEAPSPGTGKTLLAQAVTYPATGKILESMTEGQSGGEWRKRITVKLMNFPVYIHFDNVGSKVSSTALASAVTSSTWEDQGAESYPFRSLFRN